MPIPFLWIIEFFSKMIFGVIISFGFKKLVSLFRRKNLKPEPSIYGEEIMVVDNLGSDGLEKALSKLLTPGIKLVFKPGVPYFWNDPKRDGNIIRHLDGKEESGTLIDGEFVPAPSFE